MNPPSTQPPPLPRRTIQLDIAGTGTRLLALLMDLVLVGAFASFLLVKILLPREQPEGLQDFIEVYRTYQQEVETAIESGEETPPAPDFTEHEAILEMAAYVQQTLLLICFIYFAGCEWWMRGSSVGKHTLGIRTAMLGGMFPPTPLQAILRAAVKTFALVAYPPFTWILLLVALFVPGRRGIHDLVAKTIVIRLPSLPPRP